MRFQDLSKLFLAAACAFNFACNSQGELVDGYQESDTAAPAATTPASDAVKPVAPAPAANPAPAASGRDSFGVQMLYPSKPGGESWMMNDEPNKDPRFDPGATLTKNADGSFKMAAKQVRMNVFTSVGYQPSQIKTYNRDALAKQGYMQSPSDWKNVEITGYIKLNKVQDATDNFCWYGRGGRHNDTQPCEGSAYKADLHFDGGVRLGKESWHVNYAYTPHAQGIKPLTGRWVGFKTVIRNLVVDGKTVVKVESWIDEAADGKSFKKIYEFTDDGSWDGNSAQCGAQNTKMALTWGGPVTTYRWDNANDVDLKWLSVRELAE